MNKELKDYTYDDLDKIQMGVTILDTAASSIHRSAAAFLKVAIGIAVLVGTVVAIILV